MTLRCECLKLGQLVKILDDLVVSYIYCDETGELRFWGSVKNIPKIYYGCQVCDVNVIKKDLLSISVLAN